MPLDSAAEVEVATDNPVLSVGFPEFEGDEVNKDELWACELVSDDAKETPAEPEDDVVEMMSTVSEDDNEVVDCGTDPAGLVAVVAESLVEVLEEVVRDEEVVSERVLVENVVDCDTDPVVVVVVGTDNSVEETEGNEVEDVVDEDEEVVEVVAGG